MAQLRTHFELHDPVTIIWREGTPEEPYKEHIDSLPVINNQITLLEIPSQTDKVRIEGLTEVDAERFDKKLALSPHEFLVNYANGTIQFHPSQEGKTLLCKYKGRGLILYPASRIYAMVSRHPDVVKTLQDMIDEMLQRLRETNLAIAEVNEAVAMAKEAAHAADRSADQANQAADEAKLATEQALLAYKSTLLVFKPPVADMKELIATYPYPHSGWTVQTYKDGNRYRFDGKEWVLIDIFGRSIQPVSEHADGLMTVAEHVKLKSIPLEVKDRVMVFCLPNSLYQGVQSVIARFPFQGELIGVEALCGEAGESDTEITVEKSLDGANWSGIMSHPVRIKAHQHVDDRSAVIDNKIVNAGDMFRLHVVKQGVNIQHVTLQLIVKI
ncbi:phage-like protein [Paenibacillus dendritiformis]|uniref:hypothetical protein n=1 Tax=Paenibacillus dendritiformis TaxID=130049 RepID=UPI0018CFB202|nr:hypothetical protein [Paenibacillus dendritiformis]MBG9794672.1 phage-like protein [Paenibacillus dendritiformis]